MNRYEQAHDLDVARAFHRPPLTYVYDKPYYPWLPPTPKVPAVNFNLNFTE